MPILFVYGVPEDEKQNGLQVLCNYLKDAVCAVEELKMTPSKVTVFFPPDRFKAGLGEKIIVIAKIFAGPDRTDLVLQKLAARICNALVTLYPATDHVECHLELINRDRSQVISRL